MGGGYFPNSGRPPGGQFLSYSFSSLVPVRHWARDPALRSWPVLLLAALVCHPVHLAFPHRPDRPRHVGRHHRVFHWPGHHRSEPEVFGRLRRDRHRGRPAWPQRLERDQRPSRLGPDHADQRAAFPGLRPGRSLASRAAAGVRLVPGPRAVPAHAPRALGRRPGRSHAPAAHPGPAGYGAPAGHGAPAVPPAAAAAHGGAQPAVPEQATSAGPPGSREAWWQHTPAAGARPAPQPAHASPAPADITAAHPAAPGRAAVPHSAAAQPTAVQRKPRPKPWWEL